MGVPLRKKVFHIVDNSFLRSVFYFPYFVAEKVTCYTLSLVGARVWIRNSYYLKTLVVGISDLDISVQFPVNPTVRQVSRIKKYHRNLKKIFPFLGEMNIYIKSDENLIQAFNTLELNRDPYLKNVHSRNNSGTHYERITFILRMFESDRVNLSICPKYRQKKWLSHFKAIGEDKLEVIEAKDIINFLSSAVSKESSKYKEGLESFLESGEFNFSSSRETILLFPHRWAVWVNVNGGIEEGIKKLGLNLDERKIIQEMIKWELMGLYTQRFLLEDNQNLDFYLKLLGRMNSLVSIENREQIDELIEKLLSA